MPRVSKKLAIPTPKTIEMPEPETEQEPVQTPIQKKRSIKVPKESKKKMIDSSGSDNSNDEMATASTSEKKNNKWLQHIRAYRDENPNVSYKDALKLAKESYSK